jgi:ATP-dependent RNA helicase DeaD
MDDAAHRADQVGRITPAGGLALSVAIVCKNNEATIGRTLESVKGLASEIVALDSGSTDSTIRLLEAHGAKVQRIQWRGHVATKQMALEACSQPWILSLDSDESLEPELATALRAFIQKDDPAVSGARVNRKVWYAGRFLEHAWQPEPRLRLVRLADVRSGRAAWTGRDPHDRLEVQVSAGRIVDLAGDLRHDSIQSLGEFLIQQVRLGQISADAMLAEGRPPSRMKLLFSPVGQVFKQLVVKGAWRDGWRGWVAAGSSAVASLAKHALHAEAQGLASEAASKGEGTAGTRQSGGGSAQGAAGIQSAEPSAGNALRADRLASVQSTPPTMAATALMTEERQESAPAPTAEEPRNDLGPVPMDESRLTGEGEPGKKKRKRRRKRKGGAGDGEGDSPERPRAQKDGVMRKRRDVDASDPDVFDQSTTFADLGLSEAVLKGLDDCGFERPTYIQKQLIPPALRGADVLGQAKTGTGKTAAFGLPLLSMAEPGIPMQAIVLAPTRELAMQITDEFNDLGRHTGLTAVTIYGGQRMQSQIDKLAKGPEIIIGTPGRVLDMLDRGYMHFQNVRFAVLDEVDRMFDIGFRDDIRKLLRKCPKERQTLVVSATVSGEIEDLARQHMRNPEKIETAAGSLTVNLVEQHYLSVEAWDKKKLLLHLLTHEEPALTLVFCRLKRRVDEVAQYLNDHGVESHAIHGDMSQSRRSSTMQQFQDGKLAVLVASDVAARGIDVGGITHVVNFDLPDDPEVYVHRIGRTARAGRRGVAWTFVTREQGKMLSQIEDLINIMVPKMDYPDFIGSPRPGGWRDEPTGGRPPVVVEGVPTELRNRFAVDEKPDVTVDAKSMASKFPGGIVPSKMPPKRMKGRVKPGR